MFHPRMTASNFRLSMNSLMKAAHSTVRIFHPDPDLGQVLLQDRRGLRRASFPRS